MKTITAYLLEFTLVHHCGSNKSEFARKLGMRRNDFCRIYNRCLDGEGSSLTALEAVLNLYFTEGYSLDDALRGYIDIAVPSVQSTPCRLCREEPQRLREQLSSESKAADQRAQIFRSAEQLLAQMERIFCTESCPTKDNPDSECPYQQLCYLLEKIRGYLNATPSE